MTVQLLRGDCREVLKTLPDESVHCCITSPPYWGLRSYLPAGHPDKPREIGSEPTVHDWVRTMVEVFRERNGNERPATVYHCLFCGEWHIGGKRPVDQTATYKRKRAALRDGSGEA